jgi:protein gp37
MARVSRDLFPLPVAAAVRPAEDLAALAAEVIAKHWSGKAATTKGLEDFRDAGALLLKAKAQCGPGKWLKWVKVNLPFDRRTATNYMRVAAQWETVSHSEGMRDALRLLTEDGREPPGGAAEGPPREGFTPEQWKGLSAAARQERLSANGGLTFNPQNDSDSIGWARWTWNVVTGCLHECPYCYARDMATLGPTARAFPNGFAPTFVPGRLKAPQNTRFPAEKAGRELGHKNVFTVSMGDLFGHWVPAEWVEAVLAEVRAAPQWNFLFLTKSPGRMARFDLPENAWVGTTVDCQARVANAEKAFRKVKAGVKWLSCEPLLEPLKFKDLGAFQWVVLGGASPSSKTPEWRPPRAWAQDIEDECERLGVPFYEKTNLHGCLRGYPGAPAVEPTQVPPELRYLPTPEGARP